MAEQPCAFHPDRMTGVSCIRCERPICPDDMIPAAVGMQCPICAGRMRDGALGRTGYEVRTRLERNPVARLLAGGQVTTLILAANIVVFLLMFATGSPTSPITLYRFGAQPGVLLASEWWRLITAMFVHIGFMHLAFNMFALYMFGPTLEERYGKARFLGLYFAAGVLGGAASLAFSDARLSAGASGGIFGILGAWLVLAIKHRSVPSMQGQLRSLMLLVGINLFISFTIPSISVSAHLGGLVGGIVVAAGLEAATKMKGTSAMAATIGGYVVVAVIAYVLFAANVVESFASQIFPVAALMTIIAR